MITLISAISFLVVILVLVMAHEVGHFVTAKASGVRVDEFGLGFPPRLLAIRRGETTYSLNLVPLGGFVKMAGEEDPKIQHSLASKSIGTRILVLGAGSLMNFLLPLLLFSGALMVPHSVLTETVVVNRVAPDSPAVRAGLRAGDTILSINRKPITNSSDLHRNIQLNLGREIPIVVQHSDSTRETVKVIPRWQPPAGQGAIGIEINPEAAQASRTITRRSEPFWKAIPLGITACIETFILFKNGIVGMFIGSVPMAVTGPVGIAQLTGEIARIGISPLMEFAAFLSINLAIVNIFPLPALDGGRIAFVLLEWVRGGKRISPKTEGLVHLIGFVMIIVFALAITYQDIMRIVAGEALIP